MEIPVLIEPVANNGYRASCPSVGGLSAEGATPDEAMSKLREQVASRLRNGTQVATLRIPAAHVENPWVEFAGMFKDDPLFDDWQRSIAEYRREVEADPDYP